MTTTERNNIDAAAKEAAISSWDAHREFVPAQVAYKFIAMVWDDLEDTRELPESMPVAFFLDYRRYSNAIRTANPYIVGELTRPA